MKIYEVCPNSSIAKDVKHGMFSVTRNVHFLCKDDDVCDARKKTKLIQLCDMLRGIDCEFLFDKFE